MENEPPTLHRKNGAVTGQPLFSVDKQVWYPTEERAWAVYNSKQPKDKKHVEHKRT